MSKLVITTCSVILVMGLLGGWDILEQSIAGAVHINLMVLFIPIGIGLFLGHPLARTAAVWMFALIYLLSFVMLVSVWFLESASIRIGADGLGFRAFPLAFVMIAILCSITAFLHWILYLPQFEEHFGQPGRGGKSDLR